MQINVSPNEDGTWQFECIDDDGNGGSPQDGFTDRGECIAAARVAGGAEEVTVTRGSGKPETYFTPPVCRIALLREDGSEVGELDAAPGEGEVGQRITLTPAGANEEAVTDG
jgi:hypothetical protein